MRLLGTDNDEIRELGVLTEYILLLENFRPMGLSCLAAIRAARGKLRFYWIDRDAQASWGYHAFMA